MILLAAVLLSAACDARGPLPEGDAFVRSLAAAQRRREEALSLYTYDVFEAREQLARDGRVRRRETRSFEVFHVKGRPVRRLVARDGRPLEGRQREREERRARELAEGLRSGKAVSEEAGLRLSRILERYHFVARGREAVVERCAVVFDFTARPGDFDLERDALLRHLAGRLWVDEEERAVALLEVHSTSPLRVALGIGATVSAVTFRAEFRRLEAGVWLPRALEAAADGKKLLFRGFRVRTTTTYENYRRFEVEVQENVRP